jgi:hypothetical protein
MTIEFLNERGENVDILLMNRFMKIREDSTKICKVKSKEPSRYKITYESVRIYFEKVGKYTLSIFLEFR